MTTTRTAFPVFLLVLIVAVAAVYLATAEMPQIYSAEMPPVRLHKHAVERHPGLAQRIRQCLNDNGPEMIFKDNNTGRYFFLCQLNNGKWGFQISEKVNGAWEEITAYYKGNGSLNELLDYFARNGITKVTTLP